MRPPIAPAGGGPGAVPDAPSATDAARAAIRYLAERKLVPTPGNYRRAWAEVGGPPGSADAEQVAQAAVKLLGQRSGAGEGTYSGLSASVREQRWSEALQILLGLSRQAPRGQWGELLASVVGAALVSGREWPSARRIDAVVAAAHEHASSDAALRAQLELLVVQWRADEPATATPPAAAPTSEGGAAEIELRRELAKQRKAHAELVEIVMSLCSSFEAIADEGSWITAQVQSIRESVRDGADRRSLAAARSLLQQALVTQQSIARSRRDALGALRDLLPHLLQRMTHLGADAGSYGDTLGAHLQAISEADSLESIADRVRGLIADTLSMQQSFDDAKRDLDTRSARAQALESEVERLERELEQASERLLTDHLTRTANRAGLEKAFERAMQGLRSTGDPLAIALLDIDDFKKVNDALGHQAGDGALRHLAGLLQGKVRAGDTVARYGGEEFVILLPGMTDVQAREMLVRVQRELTREVYLYESKQIFITFSAGTTRVDPRDTIESALGRADDALYQAKHAGKNCVAIA
ncbi:MAG TPA: GGDEF domain-containing protein [Burkholderiaceae bacterium]|nr:GGDEF domain-containing protein [Burkholderiaceae bacterium]